MRGENMDCTELKIVFVDEKTIFQSVVSDFITFGFMVITLWINYEYLGNSVLVKSLFLVFTILILISRANGKTKKMDPKEALDFLNKNYGEPT